MQFIEQANKHHPIIKFTAEISETETFLDTNIYKGERFRSNSFHDVRTHFKPTETFHLFALLFVPPTRGQKRRSTETSQKKLF